MGEDNEDQPVFFESVSGARELHFYRYAVGDIELAMDAGTAEMYGLEAMGVELVKTMVARAGLLGAVPTRRVVGPDFDYEQSPALFAGRTGRGPLRVAIDTNILIDYFDHGHAMWAGEPMAEAQEGEYGEQLEALQLILAVWVLRDIEFVMLRESLRDSKRKPLSEHRNKRNRQGWAEFYRALTHSPHHSAGGEAAGDGFPLRLLDRAVEAVPAGGDRRLVRGALRDGAHVYLTRDQGVVDASRKLRAFGLAVMLPGDLLEALSIYGALDFLWDPQSLSWPLPDQEKVAHLLWALPKSSS